MRLSLIISVLALTAVLFYSAVQFLPATTVSATSTATIAGLQNQIVQAEASRATVDQHVLELNSTVDDLTADNLDRVAALETAISENAELRSDLAEASLQLTSVRAEKSDLDADNLELNEQLATLTTDLESRESALRQSEASLQTLNSALGGTHQEVEVLQATIADLEQERATLTQQLINFEALAAASALTSGDEDATVQRELETELANEIANHELQIATLIAEMSNLSDEVAQRDTIIVGLLERAENATVPTNSYAPVMASCQENSDALLSSLTDIFEPRTAVIAAESIPLLKELAVIAVGCIEENLTLEIEGHTGTGGGVASNLLMSDGRAKAVRAFLIEQGVPTSAVRAVGFGGSDPVSDDETSSSQPRNERIVFDWEQN